MDTIHVLGMLSRNVHVFYRIRSRHTFLLARSPERLSPFPVQETVVQMAPHHGLLFRYICLHVDTERLYVHGPASLVALWQTGLRGFRQSPAERQAPSPADYALDYRKAIALTATSDDPVKTIEWTHYQGIPLYRLRTVSKEVTLDASTNTIRPFRITEEMILAAVKRLAGDSTTYSITKMNEYDNYYISRRRPLPLPVYKVTFDNKAKDCYYYNLESFRPVHYDTNGRWKRWLYRGLHTLDIKFLVERPALWTVVIWTLLLGGAVVSFTGIVLSVKYLKNRFIKFVKFIRFIK